MSQSASLSGGLSVNLINNYTPPQGDSYQILTFASKTGNFTAEFGLYFGGSEGFSPTFTPSTNPTSLDLAVISESAGTQTMVKSAENPSNFGDTVTFTATVAPAISTYLVPTGQVKFMDGSTQLETETLVNGAASYSTSALAAGSHSIVVQYEGDSNFAGSNSTILTQVVNQIPTTTVVTPSSASTTYGQPKTFTATVGSTIGAASGRLGPVPRERLELWEPRAAVRQPRRSSRSPSRQGATPSTRLTPATPIMRRLCRLPRQRPCSPLIRWPRRPRRRARRPSSALRNQTIYLSATVTSSAGIVNEGTETFTVLSGTIPVGTSATAGVSQGAVSATYTLPGGTTVGTYTIEAVYNGTADYGTSTDTSHSLTVNAAGPTIMWNTTTAPSGGDWDTPGNWVGGVVPTASNNVVINLTSSETVTHSTGANDAVLSLTINGNTALSIGSGSIALGNRSSTFGGPVVVNAGATLSVGAGASVLLTDGQTITDNGALTFATGDSMNFYTYYGASQIVVNGTMTATGDTFNTLSGGGASIQVESGGHLTAASSTFNINQLSLNNASVYGSGDLTGDTFNMPVYVPYGDVQYLADNVKFEQVYINANTLPAGQTLALNQIGTNTSSLQYVFSGGLTIASGATLNVAPSISVLLTDGQTITDNGALTFATGDSMNFYSYYGASQIVVNGTMTATGDTFTTLSGGGASIQVRSGGHLTAASSTFNINQLSLNNASVYGSGDLTGDTFNMPVYVPYGDVQYLAGNVKFEQVYINANTLPAGQTLALNQIGTNTSSLQYVFPGGFTIASGATLNVAPSISVLLTDGQTITDNGALTFATGDSMNFYSYYGASQIVVNGTMTATGDTFTTLSGGGASIQVGSGGHLTAVSSTFNINQLSLNNASVYDSGDLTGDTFNMSVYVPYGDVQYLAENFKFEQVYINANTLPAGQTLALNQIGTNTSSLQYVFSGGFTIASGATLNVAPSISVLLTDGQTITDNGALTFATGDSMNFYTYYGASQIVVNGTMTATGDTFTTLSGGGASIQVGSGGHLTAVSSTFNINQLSLNNASVYGSGDLTGDTFNMPVYVPYGDVQYLADNVKFEQVYINANTLPAGQTLALNQIGTNTSSLQYVFSGGFTIASGATLNVAPAFPYCSRTARRLPTTGR